MQYKENNIIDFVQQFILKSGEKIEKIEQHGNIQTLTIVKHSARIYKKVAQIKIAKQLANEIVVPKVLVKYKFSPKAKRQLDEPVETIYQWLSAGWIVREIRYNVDGLSVKEEVYRMGPTYMDVLEQQQVQDQQQYNFQLTQLFTQAEALQMPQSFQKAMRFDVMPSRWNQAKRLKFIQFCIAFYQLAQRKDLFDFKEIGATYEDRIGASKMFDAEREEFLAYLEQFNIDVANYGLVSIGKIVPFYFAGHAQAALATYEIGAVHATTDNAVLQTTFITNNTTLWLVENRAILTRMATESEFLQKSNSFVLCLDGQIRSAHKQLIKQLLCSAIQQVLIWTDYDVAGLTIAKNAIQLLSCPYKIIGRYNQLFMDISLYEQWLQQEGKHEQEQQLGGREQWETWV
ncbi:DUF2399 domain-containing protein [Metasolibacillus meyeri]|uniref:DUF2399 domain-containing protein n=1 Tax=Metasolibacillus meyeri TaxID=1071052 RepID=A0AAW9NVQ6_9BACL|nr:DUF2399 domain-containing protein [Metasolibacillus meyeri]MEC1179013.1 DUF2399 domain-containing protein [Metasolibacillus meyeri]